MKVATILTIKQDWNRRTTMRIWKKMTALVLAAAVMVGTPLAACAKNAWIDGRAYQQSDDDIGRGHLALCGDGFSCNGSGSTGTYHTDERV